MINRNRYDGITGINQPPYPGELGRVASELKKLAEYKDSRSTDAYGATPFEDLFNLFDTFCTDGDSTFSLQCSSKSPIDVAFLETLRKLIPDQKITKIRGALHRFFPPFDQLINLLQNIGRFETEYNTQLEAALKAKEAKQKDPLEQWLEDHTRADYKTPLERQLEQLDAIRGANYKTPREQWLEAQQLRTDKTPLEQLEAFQEAKQKEYLEHKNSSKKEEKAEKEKKEKEKKVEMSPQDNIVNFFKQCRENDKVKKIILSQPTISTLGEITFTCLNSDIAQNVKSLLKTENASNVSVENTTVLIPESCFSGLASALAEEKKSREIRQGLEILSTLISNSIDEKEKKEAREKKAEVKHSPQGTAFVAFLQTLKEKSGGNKSAMTEVRLVGRGMVVRDFNEQVLIKTSSQEIAQNIISAFSPPLKSPAEYAITEMGGILFGGIKSCDNPTRFEKLHKQMKNDESYWVAVLSSLSPSPIPATSARLFKEEKKNKEKDLPPPSPTPTPPSGGARH